MAGVPLQCRSTAQNRAACVLPRPGESIGIGVSSACTRRPARA